MEYWFLALLQLIPLIGFSYFYVKRRFSFWENLGVKGPPPSLLKFGNLFLIGGNPPPKIEVELREKYGKVYGNYTGFLPVLTVSDSELIKQILVKDFPFWVNRRQLNGYHELNNIHQFNAEDLKWKRMRTITGKSFTSGKLRSMQAIMEQCIDRLAIYLTNLAKTGNGVLNTKEIVAGFTIDVIALSSFATETNANGDRKNQNPFVKHAIQLFDKINPFVALSYFCMPRWFNDLLGIKVGVNSESTEFFINLSREMLNQRQKSGKKQNDLLQLLIDSYANDEEINDSNYDKLTASGDKENDSQAIGTNGISKVGKSKLTDNEIIAQSLLFFVAGFETTSSVLSNTIYELTVNPDVQERLRSELEGKLSGLPEDSELYYETVMSKIPYLTAVMKETLRKYAPIVRLERRLNADNYKLAGIPLTKGQLVEISTPSVHYNPEYFPEPERYNPDRFLPENKHLLKPYTYLPFGDGPRNCVGMRFAYQEILLCLAKIVPKIKFSKLPQTPKEPIFDVFKPVLYTKPFQVKVDTRV